MNTGVLVRVLVPTQLADGKIAYRLETRRIRLPLKRDDRFALNDRL
jgi:hypothetical protein